jgi:hypothetical protein
MHTDGDDQPVGQSNRLAYYVRWPLIGSNDRVEGGSRHNRGLARPFMPRKVTPLALEPFPVAADKARGRFRHQGTAC